MSKAEKLLTDFINTPYPKWREVENLLNQLGYEKKEGDGSRVKFVNKELESVIDLHKPHPGNTIKTYVKKNIVKLLKDEGFI